MIPKEEMLFCSVPIPGINDYKGAAFDFTPEQIASYGQSQTHPSIVYAPNGFGGHKYWLASTPYPGGGGVFECPCIYYGDEDADGNPPRVFYPIAGTASGNYSVVDNPIVKLPNNSTINSDPDLLLDSGVLYMISRENTNAYATYMQKSANGQAWTPRGASPLWRKDTGFLAGKPELLSPAIVKIGANYRVYCITGTAGIYPFDEQKNRGVSWGIYILNGTTLENGGDFQLYGRVNLTGHRRIEPWHGDVFIDPSSGNLYYIFSGFDLTQVPRRGYLYLAESTDGVNFHVFARPLIASYQQYRPTAMLRPSDRELIVYWCTESGAPTDASYYPRGASDIPIDGRAIGVSHVNFDDLLAAFKKEEIQGWE